MIKIVQSKNDNNEYLTYTLDNGLRVFLISDINASVSAVALMVKVGYMNDIVQGTAHLLEHMLFMGTKKYPEEAGFQNFISHNGGVYNAWTAHDHTCYHFTINNAIVGEGLERFSDFFIQPLLKKSSLKKEIPNVNSEHEKNINDDIHRMLQLIKINVIPEHGYHNFGTGNGKTLDNENIADTLWDFYNKTYSSNNMTLVVLSSKKIKDLIEFVNPLFKQIESRPVQFNNIQSGILMNDFSKIYMNAHSEIKSIKILWDVESFYDDYYSSPVDLFCHLLGNECNGSIYSNLIQKRYINSLASGNIQTIKDRCIIIFDAEVTDLGMEHIDEIIGCVFQYINLIKDQIENVRQFNDELNKIKENNFIAYKRLSPDTTVEKIVHAVVLDIKPEKVLEYKYVGKDFDKVKPNLLKLIEQCNKYNIIIFDQTPFSNASDILKEEYYGTEYIKSNVEDIHLTNFPLSLPPKNMYISEDLSLIKSNDDMLPIRILKGKYKGRCFWKSDIRFNSPNVIFTFRIYLKQLTDLIAKNGVLTSDDIKKYLSLSLFIDCITKIFKNELYLLGFTRSGIGISLSSSCIDISGTCYSDILPKVIELIIKMLMYRDIPEYIFESVIDEEKSNNLNIKHSSPFEQIHELFYKKVQKFFVDHNDILKEIDSIKIDDVRTAFDNQIGYIIGFVCGNIYKQRAEEVVSQFLKNIKIDYYNPKIDDLDNIKDKITSNIEVKVENKYDHNSAIYCCIPITRYKLGDSVWNKLICYVSMFHRIIKEKYFNQMRTEKNYGYIARSSVNNTGSINIQMFYNLLVQTPNKKNVLSIKKDDLLFLEKCKKYLEEIDDATFKKVKDGLMEPLMTEFENEFDLFDYYLHQIISGYYEYNMKKILIETYRDVKKSDIISFYEKYVNTKPFFISIVGN
jgi:insulysin